MLSSRNSNAKQTSPVVSFLAGWQRGHAPELAQLTH